MTQQSIIDSVCVKPEKKNLLRYFHFLFDKQVFFCFHLSLSLSYYVFILSLFLVCRDKHTRTHTWVPGISFISRQSTNQSDQWLFFSCIFFEFERRNKKNQMYSKWLSQLVINNFFSCFRFIISFNHHHHQLLLDDHQQHHWHSSIISLFFLFSITSHHRLKWKSSCSFVSVHGICHSFIYFFIFIIVVVVVVLSYFILGGRKKERKNVLPWSTIYVDACVHCVYSNKLFVVNLLMLLIPSQITSSSSSSSIQKGYLYLDDWIELKIIIDNKTHISERLNDQNQIDNFEQ